MIPVPDFSAMDRGAVFDVVAIPVFFDAAHEAHVLQCVASGRRFSYKGLLELGYIRHSLFQVQFMKQYPYPKVQATEHTRVLDHEVPTWHSLRSVIDACSGIGALSQGALAAGFVPSVAVDSNHRMVELCEKTSPGVCIQGDIGDDSTLFDIWKHGRYSNTMSAGFSCQPFSRLGDGKSGNDPRSACLSSVLRAAYMLQVQILVLECVKPAASDEFVKSELSQFQKHTGFHCRQVNLSLQDAWPTRRDRAWWILTSPLVGPIDVAEMPIHSELDSVRKLIPKVFPWSNEDEDELSLTEVELEGFGVVNDAHHRYLLNFQGQSPCALHSWGSQLLPCPCGCRSAGLAQWRLDQKGLFSLLVKSCGGRIRHVHPNEAMMLNALDPIPDLGRPRLALTGVGQLASPLQALWIFSHIDQHLNMYRFGDCPFTPGMQLVAYRSWLIMRGRQVWFDDHEPIDDMQFLALVDQWKQVKDLSLAELVYPFRWPMLAHRDITIAGVLDFLLQKPNVSPQESNSTPHDDEEATPWYDTPLPTAFPVYPQADVCIVHFAAEAEAPVSFCLPADSSPSLSDFMIAQTKLAGPTDLQVTATCEGHAFDVNQALQVGQVIVLNPQNTMVVDTPMHSDETPMEPLLEDSVSKSFAEASGPPTEKTEPASDLTRLHDHDCDVISPTAEWTQVPQPVWPEPSQVLSRPQNLDAHTGAVDTAHICSQSWISAAPLLGLHGDQFLKLSLPCVLDNKHLISLRRQCLAISDRLTVLENQGTLWADDEIRFHMEQLQTEVAEYQAQFMKTPTRKPVVLDPLLTAGWLKTSGVTVHQWASLHPEILRDQLPILAVLWVDAHWIPVYMNPIGAVLHVFTWDETSHDDAGFPSVIQTLGSSLGFQQVSINQQKRIFFSTSLCGALAIAFLRHSVLNSMLPSNSADAMNFHAKFRSMFVHALQHVHTTVRPWVWGHGLDEVGSSSHDDKAPHDDSRAPCSQAGPSDVETGISQSSKGAAQREWRPLPRMPPQNAEASQPAMPVQQSNPQHRWRQISVFDVGEFNTLPASEVCPHAIVPFHHLLNIEAPYLPRVSVPEIKDTFHLWYLRHQFVPPNQRLELVRNQGPLWADDEIRHQIGLLRSEFVMMQIDHCAPPIRRVMAIDPLLTCGWLDGKGILPQQWASDNQKAFFDQCPVVTAVLARDHWIPLVLIPDGKLVRTFSWDHSDAFHPFLTNVLRQIGIHLGFSQVYVQHDIRSFQSVDRCGALAISFMRHLLLHERLPECPADLLELHDRFRASFAAAPNKADIVDRPWIWGQGDEEFENDDASACQTMPDTGSTAQPSGHDLPHGVGSPPHVCLTVDQRLDLLRMHGKEWGDDEISFHLKHLLQFRSNLAMASDDTPDGFLMMEPLIDVDWSNGGSERCREWCLSHPFVRTHEFSIVSAFLVSGHWFPVWFSPRDFTLQVHIMDDVHAGTPTFMPMIEMIAELLDFPHVVLHWIPPRLMGHELCGAMALAFLGNVLVGSPIPDTLDQLRTFHAKMKATFVQALYEGYTCRCPKVWGAGGTGFLTKQLAQELLKHGVPEDVADSRASEAIKAIGSDPISNALQGKQVWHQLKSLANNVRFKFLLPAELAQVVKNNEGKPVGKKTRSFAVKATMPSDLEIDPTKLVLFDGCFRMGQQPIAQISLAQVGPIARGVAIVSPSEAEPYLRKGTTLSQEPLALAIVGDKSTIAPTMLAHVDVTVPCRCTVNQEPILADVRLVQLGHGHIAKHTADSPIALDALEVLTLKVLVYRDEIGCSWEEFCSAPIKTLVSTFPALARCFSTGCQCLAWHNPNQLPLREPIMDVWRRQFLRNGFKPCTPQQADLFSVCIRIPAELMPGLLANSGTNGCYTEPRTEDGKEVLKDFVVVWAPRMPLQDLLHCKQTNPAVIGVARTGDRRGLRVRADQAKQLHSVLKPEVMFLPSGPRMEFLAGPFPYGVDRAAIARALKHIEWEVKPLQPTAPVPGRGTMWILQAVVEPPETIVQTSHGEVVISRRKSVDTGPKQALAQAIGDVGTLSLCGNQPPGKPAPEVDPWSKHDPWRSYQATGINSAVNQDNESMQQLEHRIQSAVLAKLPAAQPMEQDDVPDRIAALETQVQTLMTKHQGIESQFHEFSVQNNQQLTSMQTQINSQTQQIHGQLESQAQSIQALFESQMAQIRGLLSKRPREEGME